MDILTTECKMRSSRSFIRKTDSHLLELPVVVLRKKITRPFTDIISYNAAKLRQTLFFKSLSQKDLPTPQTERKRSHSAIEEVEIYTSADFNNSQEQIFPKDKGDEGRMHSR